MYPFDSLLDNPKSEKGDIHTKKDKEDIYLMENAGYIIKDQITVNGETYVLGHNPNPNVSAPFVTWAADLGKNYFAFGHYFAHEKSARQDLFHRAMEVLPQEDIDSIVLNHIRDELKSAIKEEGRMENWVGDIESCLDSAFFKLGIDKPLSVLMESNSFMRRALHAYHNIDHSYENEALTETLERMIKEHFSEILPNRTSSVDALIQDASERTSKPDPLKDLTFDDIQR